MKNYSRQYLKGLLRDYPLLQERIEVRKESIRNPDRQDTDENIGGSSGNRISDVVGSVAIKVADDELINVYEYYRVAIDTTLKRCNEDTQKIIAMRYFEQLNQDDVSKKLALTVAVIRACENDFLKKLGRRLKLMR